MIKNPNLINNIQSNFSKLSKGQKIIGEFIINNYDKAAFMTAANLGSTLNVSESTVVRFANTLGYSGYKELQKELQEVIKNKLTTVQRMSLAEGIEDDNNISRVMESDIENIKKTVNELDKESIHKSVQLVTNAKNIYVIGLRSSSFLAGYFCFYLNFLFSNVRLITSGANDIFERLVKIGKDDVVIALTFPRYSKKTVEALSYLNEKGCKIISITDSLISPVANKSDITLIARSDMVSFVDSLVAPMSLINAFLISLSSEMKKDINLYFEELEKIWKTYNIYEQNNVE